MIIEFQIQNKKYKIDGLTLLDLYHIQDEFILNPHAALSITSYLSGCPEDALRDLDLEDFNILWDNVQEFIRVKSLPKEAINKRIKHGGQYYYLINPDDLSIGEFADLDIIVNSPGSEKRLHEVAAILYRPLVDGEIEEYNTKTAKKRADEFKLLPVSEANKATNFFLLSGIQYLNSTADYLKSVIKEEKQPETKEILQTTLRLLLEAGTKLSLSYQATTSYSSTPPPGLISECPSISLLISKTGQENKNWNYKKLFKNISVN